MKRMLSIGRASFLLCDLALLTEPISGFEPETPSLRVKCSTAELNRQTRLAISFSFHKVSNNFYSKAVCY